MTIQVGRFAIGQRKAGSYACIDYEPNSLEYTYVASAINIGLSMMEHSDSKKALTKLALAFDNQALRGKHFGGSSSKATKLVDWFVTNLRNNYPCVLVDEHINTIDCLGYHPRWAWQGQLSDFFPKNTGGGIHLNASRVYDMIEAARQGKHQRFRDFQFIFATTVLHETGGHYLITLLGGGRVPTPPEMTALDFNRQDPLCGESGRLLEQSLFGGNSEFYRDFQQSNQQAGVPHQVDRHGVSWKIDPQCINDACMHKFKFPFKRIGPQVPTEHQVSMGRYMPYAPTDTNQRALLAAKRPDPKVFKNAKRYTVRLDELRKIPYRPGTLLSVVS